MKKLIAVTSALALGLTLAACESEREEVAEEQTEMLEEDAATMEAGTMTETTEAEAGAAPATTTEATEEVAEEEAEVM